MGSTLKSDVITSFESLLTIISHSLDANSLCGWISVIKPQASLEEYYLGSKVL
jgi:hypothetical protein